jgi:hypothetical protein
MMPQFKIGSILRFKEHFQMYLNLAPSIKISGVQIQNLPISGMEIEGA